MSKAKDLRDKSQEELEADLIDMRKELYVWVNDTKQSKKIDQPSFAKNKRKEIARVLTVIREKELKSSKSK